MVLLQHLHHLQVQQRNVESWTLKGLGLLSMSQEEGLAAMLVADAVGIQVPELEENVFVGTGTMFITNKIDSIEVPSAG